MTGEGNNRDVGIHHPELMPGSEAEPEASRPSDDAGPERHEEIHVARRIGAFVVWWTLLMALWVWIDDTIALAELLGGAAVAAMGALFVELVSYQTGTRFKARVEWLSPLVSLPADVVKDTLLAFQVLWSRLVRGEEPDSGYRVLPKAFGDDSAEGATRRALLTGGRSIAPNTFVIGLDRDTDLMVVHQLVVTKGAPLDPTGPSAPGARAS